LVQKRRLRLVYGAIHHIPEDVKGIVAANIVQLTFGQKDYLLNIFERIVIYPGTFPTIQYPKHFHASEIFAEDGVLLFAMDHLMPGTLHADQYFNIGLYEYAFVGLENLDVWAVSVVFFFSFPERFKTQLSDLYQTHSNLFNQHPAKLEEPASKMYQCLLSN